MSKSWIALAFLVVAALAGCRHAPDEEQVRKAIAARLTASKQSIPHFYLRRTATIDELLALRARLNQVAPHKISVNDLVLRAARAIEFAEPMPADAGA